MGKRGFGAIATQGLAWVITCFPEGSGDFQGKHMNPQNALSLQEASYKLQKPLLWLPNSSSKIHSLDSLDDQYEGSLSKSYQRYIYAYSQTQPFHFWGFSLHLTCLMMCERKGHYSKFLKWQKTENNPRTHQWQNWLNKLCFIHTIEFYVCRAKKEWGNTLCTATEISPRYIVKLKETRCGTVWRNRYCLYYKAGKKWRVSVHLDFLVCA